MFRKLAAVAIPELQFLNCVRVTFNFIQICVFQTWN